MLTTKRLHELLNYNPRTGIFKWKVNRWGRFARKGVKAGTLHSHGHILISVNCKIYSAHRLAYFWMTGRWPKKGIDHIDCDPSNNRWLNLRLATPSQNGANSRQRRNKPYSQLKGVTMHWKNPGRYIGCIRVNYRNIYLGTFDSAKEAHAAYAIAAKKYFGDFARTR